VGVDDVRLQILQQLGDAAVRAEILDRQDGAEHFVDDDDAVAVALRALHQRAFGADRGAGDERDVVPAVVLTLTGEQGVLLRAADDQARDDVNDLHDLAREANGGGVTAEARAAVRLVT
jgi:hypothetical protein